MSTSTCSSHFAVSNTRLGGALYRGKHLYRYALFLLDNEIHQCAIARAASYLIGRQATYPGLETRGCCKNAASAGSVGCTAMPSVVGFSTASPKLYA